MEVIFFFFFFFGGGGGGGQITLCPPGTLLHEMLLIVCMSSVNQFIYVYYLILFTLQKAMTLFQESHPDFKMPSNQKPLLTKKEMGIKERQEGRLF